MNRFPLLWMATAFIAGVISANFFCFYPILTLTILLFLFLAENFFSLLRLSLAHYLLVFLFFWGGFLETEWNQVFIPENDISKWVGQNILYTGIIDEAVAHYPDHATLILKTEGVEVDHQWASASGRVKVNVNRAIWIPLSYGDEIKVPLELREPHGFKNLGQFDYGLYLRRQGIRATASLTHPEEILVTGGQGGSGILRVVYRWREEIREKANRSLKGDSLAIFLAITIGESGYLTNEIRDAYMASGTTHILSISGSHLALVALLVFHIVRSSLLYLPEPLLLRLSRRVIPSKLALWCSIPPVLLYGLLAGNQVATNRSMMMIVVFLIGQFLNREQNLLNPLALSALVILLFDPLEVYDISFQLSFGSVLSIALILDRMNSRPAPSIQDHPLSKIPFFSHPKLNKWYQDVKNYLWISLATTVGTAPLVAYHFNQFNWVGLIANSLIIPFVGFIIVPIALLSSFLSLAFSSPSLYLANLNQFLFIWFYKLVKMFASFPYAELHLASPSPLQLCLFYSMILSLLYFRIHSKMKIFLVAIVVMAPLLWYFGPRFHFPSRTLTVTFLDVGQGDSAYILFPDGKNMLIDGGGLYHEFDVGRLAVAPFLWNQGVQQLDYLVATHPQADHIGGLIYILKKFSIGEVWTNGTIKSSRIFDNLEKEIEDRHLNRKIVQEGDQFRAGETDLLVLNPHLKDPVKSPSHAQENNDGIVLMVRYRQQSALFTADIEKEAEGKILSEHPGMKITLLKVPHHGGKSSADSTFVRTLSPEISLFSVGAHNSYHHPNRDTLKLYQSIKTRIYRTDRDGELIFKTDGDRCEEISAIKQMPARVLPGKNILQDELNNLKRLL